MAGTRKTYPQNQWLARVG